VFSPGTRVVLCVRPQHVKYAKQRSENLHLKGIIQSMEYVGGMQHMQILVEKSFVLSTVSQNSQSAEYKVGSEVYVGWDPIQTPIVPDEGAFE